MLSIIASKRVEVTFLNLSCCLLLCHAGATPWFPLHSSLLTCTRIVALCTSIAYHRDVSECNDLYDLYDLYDL